MTDVKAHRLAADRDGHGAGAQRVGPDDERPRGEALRLGDLCHVHGVGACRYARACRRTQAVAAGSRSEGRLQLSVEERSKTDLKLR